MHAERGARSRGGRGFCGWTIHATEERQKKRTACHISASTLETTHYGVKERGAGEAVDVTGEIQ